jgi:hypothetical protein
MKKTLRKVKLKNSHSTYKNKVGMGLQDSAALGRLSRCDKSYLKSSSFTFYKIPL